MLDATLPTNLTLGFDWRDKLSPGDIVMFRFPLEDQTMPTEKIRCLVLEIEAVGTTRFAVLIPALPSRRPSDHARIISIGKRTELDAAGLDLPTQFVVQDRWRVPLTHERFVGINPAQTTGLNAAGWCRGMTSLLSIARRVGCV